MKELLRLFIPVCECSLIRSHLLGARGGGGERGWMRGFGRGILRNAKERMEGMGHAIETLHRDLHFILVHRARMISLQFMLLSEETFSQFSLVRHLLLQLRVDVVARFTLLPINRVCRVNRNAPFGRTARFGCTTLFDCLG